MSVGHFTRSFTRAFGESPVGYLTSRRLQRAMALLQGTSLSVTEVCYAVGFSSLGTFSRRFSQWVGVTPSVCRRERHYPILPGCVARGALRPVRIGEAPESLSGVPSAV
jgi:AraC-like DNA-binding protein